MLGGIVVFTNVRPACLQIADLMCVEYCPTFTSDSHFLDAFPVASYYALDMDVPDGQFYEI